MYCSNCDTKILKDGKFCSSCGDKVLFNKESNIEKKDESSNKIKENINNKNGEKAEFAIIPITRLIIFSILSFGFYSVYWFALNFNAIENRRKKRNKKTRSAIWGLLNNVTSDILFRELYLIKKENTGKGFKVNPSVLAFFYFMLMVFGAYIFLTPFVFIFTAIYFQKEAKKYSKYKIYKLNWREFAVVGFAIIVFFISYHNEKENITYVDFEARRIIAESVREINRDLPEMIDSETRLDIALLLGPRLDELNYKYTLINTNREDLEFGVINQTMRSDLIDFVCNSGDMKILRDNNYNVRYNYYDKNNIFIEDILIDTNKDCY